MTFAFCQQCGYKRKHVDAPHPSPSTSVDLEKLDARLLELDNRSKKKLYSKQKDKLQEEFTNFLSAIPGEKHLLVATAKDVVRFLAWKDKSGRTKVHSPQCRYFSFSTGSKQTVCKCPTRLAAGSVDSLIGKLRAIFATAGRGNSWNDVLGVGNPAAHTDVKKYLKAIQEEQAQARVTPKQAVPLFFEKLHALCKHLRTAVFVSNATPTQRYTAARDLAFFCLAFFSADRATDLGRTFTKEVGRLPNHEGLIFNHTFGKTLRGGNSNAFIVKRCDNPTICPVANLETYVTLCDLMKVELRDGFLFRTLSPRGEVSQSPFVGSAVANRLTLHLKDIGLHEGETMHSFRSGCSITLSMLGVTPEEVAQHAGWRTRSSLDHYCKLDKVFGMQRTATTLAESTSKRESTGEAAAAIIGREFTKQNVMSGTEQAFPRIESQPSTPQTL